MSFVIKTKINMILLEPVQVNAPAKRSQHLNATDRNIAGRNMLHATVLRYVALKSCDVFAALKAQLKLSRILLRFSLICL